MPAASINPRAPPRKRNRKRKRRNLSSSESSSDSDESESGSSEANGNTNHTKEKQKTKATVPVVDESSSSSSESESSSSESESGSAPVAPVTLSSGAATTQKSQPTRLESPPPPSTSLPSFLPQNNGSEQEKEKEALLKERFRKFWMASVADGFVDDLNEIRKESNLTTSRLSMLIDSLAAGADVYDANEMELVLDG
ncbi:hypothetical protein BD410DRAFT_822565 [Rickenella mellea]|uniref:Ribosome assembly protein 3 n=1 Tax=Rickenella mellea TaxID=50990 RepID=A0A4Y7PRC5_9AGAM|nr:hypothetical protein BD410DRAFT_822565 [Rickenella mellea]